MASFFEKLKRGMGTDFSKEKTKKEEAEKNAEDVFPELFLEKSQKAKKPKRAKKEEASPTKETLIKKPLKQKKIKIKEEAPTAVFKEPKEEKLVSGEKSWFEPEGQLAIDVYQTNGEIIIQSAIAGVKPEEINISIENDVARITGERNKTFEKEERNYFYQECYWGKFSREIILPAEVDASRAEATMKEGILTIRIPKIEREKKKIIVKKH